MAAAVDPTGLAPDDLLGRVEAGSVTQADVEAWVAAQTGRTDRSDWIEWVASLGEAIRVSSRNATASPDRDRALAVLNAAHAMAAVDPVPGHRAVVAVHLAAHLMNMGRNAQSVPYWQEAANAFQMVDRATWQELTSLKQWIDALRREGNLYEALDVAERMVERAVALGVRPAEVTARYLRGILRSRVGRDGALEDLQSARAMSTSIDTADRAEYEVPDDEVLISVLGVTARTAGDYELSLKTLDELIELGRSRNDAGITAEGWSELGYTHEAFQEVGRAITALTTAADIGDTVSDVRATVWRRNARMLAGIVDDTDPEVLAAMLGPVTGVADAYERDSILVSLAKSERFTEVLALSGPVLDWSRAEGVVDLEMSLTGLVAVSLARTGDLKQAIRMSHKAILMAEKRQNYAAGLRFRQNLSLAFRLNDQLQEAVDTLLAAIAPGEILLQETRGSDARQRLAAGLLGTTAALAGLYSRSDHHISMIAATERARSRNLEEWMRMAAAVASQGDPGAARAALERLRAAEVELEVRQIAGSLSGPDLRALTERRDADRASALKALSAIGEDAMGEPVGVLAPDITAHLTAVLEPGRAIVFLFEADEGICAAVASLEGSRLRVRGAFIPWEIDARRADIQPWTVMMKARSAREFTGSFPTIAPSTERLQASFYEPLAAVVRQAAPRDLFVVPQGNLALLPYWELLRLVGAGGMLGIVPSLDVLRLCLARTRTAQGPTLIVGDVVGDLTFAPAEIRFVRDARGAPIHETTIAEDVLDEAVGAHVVHVAAHGIFNPVNPYLGGILVDESPGDRSRFVQYVSGDATFSDTAAGGGRRLLTVAECMTGLSLDACRVAILSACESGVPSLHGGGELTGLPNAFLLAGAQSVVASLWRVDDAATATLMYHFYDAFTRGAEDVPVATALSVARDRLAASTREEIVRILGVDDAKLPNGDRPFDDPYFVDAFQCYGAF